MSRVWEESHQAGGALLVLLAIADFADDEGLAFPSIRTLARKARLSERQTQRVIAQLVSAGELNVKPGCGRQGSHLFRVAIGAAEAASSSRQDVTRDRMSPRHRRRRGVTSCRQERVTPASPKPSDREPSLTITPLPPAATTSAQRQRGQGIEPTGKAHPSPPDSGAASGDADAWALANALYRGLGSDLAHLTPALRRREMTIARQLVAVGATAGEAEAYGRDARAQAGRIAAVDVRSFERERLSWNARRQAGQQATVHRVDRTGEPPGGMHAGSIARALFGPKS